MEQHCEVQQQLLQHVFVEKHFGEAGGDDDYSANALQDGSLENGYDQSFESLENSFFDKSRYSICLN